MNENNSRIDKFLWSVRLFKTRSLATETCKKGRISIDNVVIKPSRLVKIGETIKLSKPPVNYSYKVIAIPKSRTSAKLVSNFIENITPKEELDKLLLQDNFFIKRDRGAGRPTKKERRLIEKIKNDN
jgi:ribosome-associated heat shock protein Hsp15